MLRLHVFNTGWLSTAEKHLYAGGGSTWRALPVLSFVIDHPLGLIVFDAGLNASWAVDARHYAGWLRTRRTPFHTENGLNLAAQMRASGLDLFGVVMVVLSHLHWDHTGDARSFPKASIVVAKREWQAAQRCPDRLVRFLPKEYDDPNLILTDLTSKVESPPSSQRLSTQDLLGDRKLSIISTIGHTAGHQSLLISLPQGPVLLAGDAVLVRENYARPVTTPHARLPDAAWRCIVGLHALSRAEPGVLILPSHDASALVSLARPDIVLHGDINGKSS